MDPVDCPEFGYIGKTIENSGLLETWLKNINVTNFDDFPTLNTYIDNEELGIELSINADSTIETLFLFRHSKVMPPITGTFEISRQDLRKMLGEPFFSYEKDPEGAYDFSRRSNDKWVSADRSKYISFTYTEDDSSLFQVAIGNQEYFNKLL